MKDDMLMTLSPSAGNGGAAGGVRLRRRPQVGSVARAVLWDAYVPAALIRPTVMSPPGTRDAHPGDSPRS